MKNAQNKKNEQQHDKNEERRGPNPEKVGARPSPGGWGPEGGEEWACPKGRGPEGWVPDLEKVRAPRVGARRVGPKAEGATISRFFFPLPPPFSLFFFLSLSLWGLSCNFGGV